MIAIMIALAIIDLKTNLSFDELKMLMDPSGFYFDKRTGPLPFVESMIDKSDTSEAHAYD